MKSYSIFIESRHNVKISVLPTLTYRFNTTLIKIQENNFVDTDKSILKFRWRGKSLRITNIILKEKNKTKGLMLPNFKT